MALYSSCLYHWRWPKGIRAEGQLIRVPTTGVTARRTALCPRSTRPSSASSANICYIKGLDYDTDQERAHMKKPKKGLKSEKGVMRELHKDNYFLPAVKEKERIGTRERELITKEKPWLFFKNRKVFLNLKTGHGGRWRNEG